MRIVAAVDRSDFADLVVGMARRLADTDTTEVLLLNVAPREADMLGRQLSRKEVEDPVPEELRDRRELLDRLAGELGASGIACSTLLVRGSPAQTIIQEASRWSADLIVVGSQGRGMLYRRMLGSVSEEVLAARRFPVLVVPGQVDA